MGPYDLAYPGQTFHHSCHDSPTHSQLKFSRKPWAHSHTRCVFIVPCLLSASRACPSPSPSVPLLSSMRSTVTIHLQPVPCVVTYLSMFSSCLLPNLSYLPELCVNGVKTKALLDSFEHHQSWLRGMHIVYIKYLMSCLDILYFISKYLRPSEPQCKG